LPAVRREEGRKGGREGGREGEREEMEGLNRCYYL